MKNPIVKRLSPSLLLLLIFSFSLANISIFASTALVKPELIEDKLAALEASSAGRLGISATNTNNNSYIKYRSEEHFPMNCTSKVFGVSAILKKSMTDSSLLQEKITYTQQEIDSAGWPPITQKHLVNGMTVSELCGAAIMQGDNAAMNILIKKLGGINAANHFLRTIGDNTSRFDRLWPAEASSIPDDLRDSSTPSAMEKSFQKLVLGNILARPQHEQLLFWLKNSTTGYARIRAGVPKNWLVGDKTGTGHYGTSNDIAIIWPPKCSPITLAIYFTQNKQDAALHEDVLASATKLIIDQFQRNDPCIKTSMG